MSVGRSRASLACCVLAGVVSVCACRASALDVIAFDDMDGALGRTSYSISVDATTWQVNDWFGIGSVASFPHPWGIPGSLADDSVVDISGGGVFPTDNLGIIDGLRDVNDSFFGASDTINPNNAGVLWAEWQFDIGGASNLSVSLDIAATGDFEGPADPSQPQPDRFDFLYAVDGEAFGPLFTSSVDDGNDVDGAGGGQSYTMQGGMVFEHDDPLLFDDGTGPVELNDVFTTFTRSIAETGATLTVRLEAYVENGGEAVAFDNIVVMGQAGPSPAPGDFDGDGDVDDADIDQYIGKLGTSVPPTDAKFDLVADGTVDLDDHAQHAASLLEYNDGAGHSGAGTLLGDTNRDGSVTLVDLNQLGMNFGSAGGWALGDTNGSGDVTLVDLNQLGANFGQSVIAAPATAPEPGTCLVVGLALLRVVSRRSRN